VAVEVFPAELSSASVSRREPVPCRINLGEEARQLPPTIRMQRQDVDDVGPVVAPLVAVAERPRGDLVSVGLDAD
jgi:hypothetical protein